MAITYPLPSPLQFGIASLEWAGPTATSVGRSPWSFAEVVQVFDGEMWRGRLEIASQDAAEGRRLAAWIAALRGRRGTFLCGLPDSPAPRGSAAQTPGAPVVDGAGQTGARLDVRGLPESAEGWLLAGDYFQLGGGAQARLFMALADVDADGDGEATIDVFPRVRAAPTDGAALILEAPEGVFRAASPATPWLIVPGPRYDGVMLDIEEVVP